MFFILDEVLINNFIIMIEEHTHNVIHYLACEFDTTLQEVSSKVAKDVYNICLKLEKWQY